MKIDPALRSRLRKRLIQEIKNPSQRNVVVKTAVSLSDKDMNALKEALPELNDAKLTNEVDPQIIGGMVIVDGSKIIDVSLKGSLDELVGKLL